MHIMLHSVRYLLQSLFLLGFPYECGFESFASRVGLSSCEVCYFVQMNGCVVSGVQLKVSVARRQPTLESVTASANTAAADNSSASWSSIGMCHSVSSRSLKTQWLNWTTHTITCPNSLPSKKSASTICTHIYCFLSVFPVFWMASTHICASIFYINSIYEHFICISSTGSNNHPVINVIWTFFYMLRMGILYLTHMWFLC